MAGLRELSYAHTRCLALRLFVKYMLVPSNSTAPAWAEMRLVPEVSFNGAVVAVPFIRFKVPVIVPPAVGSFVVSVLVGISAATSTAPAITRPLASIVTLEYVPAVTPVLDKLAVTDPAKNPAVVTSPVIAVM